VRSKREHHNKQFAKMGISAQQVVDINSTETEITSQQATAVVQIYFKSRYTDALVAQYCSSCQYHKVGISAQQALDITANNAKIEIEVHNKY
jgi:hypothetical protein